MTTTATDEYADHPDSAVEGGLGEDQVPEHHSDRYYIQVALILAVLTAIETSTYWIDFGPFMVPTLLIIMAIKFLMVVLIFMHLREEKPIYKYLFYAGLLLALGVYAAALAAFHFFA